MKQLPIPLEFRLPSEEWTSQDPDALGVPTAAFLALRGGPGTEAYSPVLTISGGWREDGASLEQIGDESLGVLGAQATEVRLLERSHHGSSRAPAITQLLAATATIDGRTLQMRQGQAVTAMVDVSQPSRAIVLLYTVTCTEDQLAFVGREFQEFMSTVRPVAPPGVEEKSGS